MEKKDCQRFFEKETKIRESKFVEVVCLVGCRIKTDCPLVGP